ncbi:hypothetical protein HK102_010576, partial [Quaeritorhiza haematococci]
MELDELLKSNPWLDSPPSPTHPQHPQSTKKQQRESVANLAQSKIPLKNSLASDSGDSAEDAGCGSRFEVVDEEARKFREQKKAEGAYETAFSDDDEPHHEDDEGHSGRRKDKGKGKGVSEGTLTVESEASSSTASPSTGAKQKRSLHAANPPPTDGMYYFYQAADGQHFYMHPLDIKIMKYEFDEYAKFPDRIEVDVISVRESTVDEDLRKRCKYLGHLPLSCDVSFCEVDLKGIVSDATLMAFEKELNQRLQRHATKERKEEQERRKQQRNQNRNRSSSFTSTGGGGTGRNVGDPGYDYNAEYPDYQHLLSGSYSSTGTAASSSSNSPSPTSETSPSNERWLGEDIAIAQSLAAATGGASSSSAAIPPASTSFARIAGAAATSASPWTRRKSGSGSSSTAGGTGGRRLYSASSAAAAGGRRLSRDSMEDDIFSLDDDY